MFPVFWQHCHILLHVFFLAFTITVSEFWVHILSSNLPVPASWLHTYFFMTLPPTHTHRLCTHCRVSEGSTASRIWADRILWSALINATQLQMALLSELDWCIGVGACCLGSGSASIVLPNWIVLQDKHCMHCWDVWSVSVRTVGMLQTEKLCLFMRLEMRWPQALMKTRSCWEVNQTSRRCLLAMLIETAGF